MKPRRLQSNAGFTLVEILMAMAIAMVVLGAVLSTYLFLGRNLGRLTYQQQLETQARRAFATFAQDVRMATTVSGTPSASSLVLTLPTGTGTTSVTYTYSSTGQTLKRQRSGGTEQTLMTNLRSFNFTYYDVQGNPYTSFSNYKIGIKQVAMTFTSQAGLAINGTRTPVYTGNSPLLLLRNKALLP